MFRAQISALEDLYYNKPINYFDYASTTPIYKEVIDVMTEAMKDNFGNPSSLTATGIKAKKSIKEATETIKKAIGAQNYNLYYTSGATESNNWVAQILNEGDIVFTTPYEHPSVLKAFESRKANLIYIDFLAFDKENFIKQLNYWRPKLVSVMGVNNETGIIPYIGEIARLCKGKALTHCDITQTIPHCIFNCDGFGFDFYTFSGHKFGAPKGIGGLLVKPSVLKNFKPMIYGGHQQFSLRAGTESVTNIIGLAKAIEKTRELCPLFHSEFDNLNKYFKETFNKKMKEVGVDYIFVGDDNKNLLIIPEIINVCFDRINGYTLMKMLDLAGFTVSTGSSCSADNDYISPMLEDLQIPENYIHGSIRISLGYTTSVEEIDNLIDNIVKCVNSLKAYRESNNNE